MVKAGHPIIFVEHQGLLLFNTRSAARVFVISAYILGDATGAAPRTWTSTTWMQSLIHAH